LLLTFAATGANACFWDRDTLRTEAAGLPGTVDVIIGWFDRWPTEVYEMRLERVASELESDPTRLDLYDDAAVASDRIGKHDEAIEWMRLKREQLDALPQPNAEHEYRYHANLGTMLAHRWFAQGSDRDQIAELSEAAKHIEKALEINPDAHFGRERLQLRFIQWIIEAPPESWHARGGILRYGRGGNVEYWDSQGSMSANDAIVGLSGLIVLGNAWESVDVFASMVTALNTQQHSSLAHLASFRVDELLNGGKNSANPNNQLIVEQPILSESLGGLGLQDIDEVRTYFEKARESANARNELRRKFILDRLAEGRHPDLESEASFWNGWIEPASIVLPNGVNGVTHYHARGYLIIAIVLVIVGVVAIATLYLLYRIVRFAVRRLNSASAA
jgi:tetratricopeptide (TPR) repeat protein